VRAATQIRKCTQSGCCNQILSAGAHVASRCSE
jgi:hypothetical protein